MVASSFVSWMLWSIYDDRNTGGGSCCIFKGTLLYMGKRQKSLDLKKTAPPKEIPLFNDNFEGHWIWNESNCPIPISSLSGIKSSWHYMMLLGELNVGSHRSHLCQNEWIPGEIKKVLYFQHGYIFRKGVPLERGCFVHAPLWVMIFTT